MKHKPNIVEKLISWVQSLRRVDGLDLPSEGKSSVDSQSGQFLQNAIGSVIPPFDLQVLARLRELWMANPDFSQHVKNIKSLGNTGHTITVDAANDSTAEAALTRINEAAARIYQNGAGVDGLMHAYFDQLSVFGALSSEDVVDFAGRRVEQVVLVPVEQIRFRYLDGKYVPHQQPLNLLGVRAQSKGQGANTALGLVELNPNTYGYYALQAIQNSPYALPPALAAVEIMRGPQKDAIDNISWILSKLGILGLVIASLKKPSRKPGEIDSEYVARATKYQQDVFTQLNGNFKKGLLVGFDDIKWDHSNVASDARGSDSIYQIVEELVFSGMGTMAAFHGRNYTTTETFADVIYNILIALMQSSQMLAKRRQERTYKLDLRLAGIDVDGISMAFNRPEARDEVKKAQAEQIRQQMVYERAKNGTISPDQGAQELGYEAAYDPELLSSQPAVADGAGANFWAKRAGFSATFRFDRHSQRYRFAPSRIEVAGAPIGAGYGTGTESERVIEFKKKAA